MTAKELFEALGEIDGSYVDEALRYRKRAGRPGWVKWCAAAACLCLAFAAAGLLSPAGGMAVTAYACGTEQEITPVGAGFTTGTIDDSGQLTGHPLMFHLAGQGIETVRFSCKNGRLSFIDLTGERAEYTLAQNFTVPYGAAEDEYASLLIDWTPSHIMEALEGGDSTVASLSPELRQDLIVMEIAFADGSSAAMAITITLEDDGTFYAAFDEYAVSEGDSFIARADAAPDGDEPDAAGELTVTFLDAEGGEVLPEANWYDTADIAAISIQWNGQAPELVQLFYTPAGSETAVELDFLPTEALREGDSLIVSAEPLHQDDLMGQLQLVVTVGGETVKSGLYNVIYDPLA